jgi:DNA-binding FadR family transcriptional regulator
MDTVNRLALMRNISMEDISAVRVHLEAMAVRLAAEHATPGELDGLEALNKEMELKKDDIDQRVEFDLAFHLRIASLSGNRMLKVFIQSLNSLLAPMLRRSLYVPMANEDGVQFHNRIIAALRSGNADYAENIIREHLMLFIRNYEESIHAKSVNEDGLGGC